MKITYEIYKNVPYMVYTDMNDTSHLAISVIQGDAIAVRFADEEKKLYRGCACFNTDKLKDGIHRVRLDTKNGSHELIPIKISFGMAKLYHGDNLLAELYRTSVEQRREMDELWELYNKIKSAVFGSKIL